MRLVDFCVFEIVIEVPKIHLLLVDLVDGEPLGSECLTDLEVYVVGLLVSIDFENNALFFVLLCLVELDNAFHVFSVFVDLLFGQGDASF